MIRLLCGNGHNGNCAVFCAGDGKAATHHVLQALAHIADAHMGFAVFHVGVGVKANTGVGNRDQNTIENSAVATGLEKVSFHSNAKECSNYCTIALISHASKVMLKILQARL